MDPTQNRHFPLAARLTMVRAMTMPGAISSRGRRACGQKGLARRDDRDGQARAADRADAAWPDRHDDQRSRADRPARRQGGRGRRARAYRAVHRLRARHGDRVGGRRRSPRSTTARGSRAWCAARCASDCGRRSSSACRSPSCSSGAASCCVALGQIARGGRSRAALSRSASPGAWSRAGSSWRCATSWAR